MEVKPTTANHITELFDSHEEVYPMTSPRGRVLIINNDEFDEACNPDQDCLDDREGSRVDLNNLEQIFEALDFIIVPLCDLSSQHLLDSITEETKHPDHMKYGMFIIAILSHGNEGVIYGSDARKVSINDITRRLSVKNFPAMADKPKMVIIQACSGSEKDDSVYKLADDNPTEEVTGLPNRPHLVKSAVSDFIIMQASYPGFKSFRDPHYGTFLIRAAIEVLREYACHDSVPDLVVRVRNKVLKMCEEFADMNIGAQTVYLSETLRKKLYFFPGMSGADSVQPTRYEDNVSTPTQSLNTLPVTPEVHISGQAADAFTSDPPPSPLPARTAVCASLPLALLDPTTALTSSSSLNLLSSLVELRHLENISTPDDCLTAMLDPSGQISHAGHQYDSVNGTRDGLSIDCIRAAQDNQLIMLERNCKTKTTHVVTYKLGQKPTAIQKLLGRSTSNQHAYRKTSKMKVQYYDYMTQFTMTDNILYQAGVESGKVYLYKFPTGKLIKVVTHPDMKLPDSICHDTKDNIYVTDYGCHSIFNITLNDGESSIIKLDYDILFPAGIAMHDGRLVVLSNIYRDNVPKLHIMTTGGEKLVILELRECRIDFVCDLCINSSGVVAIANSHKGVQLYKFE